MPPEPTPAQTYNDLAATYGRIEQKYKDIGATYDHIRGQYELIGQSAQRTTRNWNIFTAIVVGCSICWAYKNRRR
jgi:hypothetical protein